MIRKAALALCIAAPLVACSETEQEADATRAAASFYDIVLSERITGVPLAVLDTPYVRRVGLKAGPVARWMLRGHRRKHWMRTLYALRSLFRLRRSSIVPTATADYWQAGRSVAGIHEIKPVAQVLEEFGKAAIAAFPPGPSRHGAGENHPTPPRHTR